MVKHSTATFSNLVTSVTSHLRIPLFRNAYMLMLNTISTAGLGLIYWWVAARLYPPEYVGANNMAISTMFLITTIASLNLLTAMYRFLPRAGQHTRRLVLYAYAISIVLTTVAATLFVIIHPTQVYETDFLGTSLAQKLWFIVACTLWAIFSLQDSVMTGLRQAHFIPIENTIYGVAKLLLLPIFAAGVAGIGIFLSWTIPIAVAIIVINLLIFVRLIPRHVEVTKTQAEPLRWGHIFHYVGGDYVGSVFWMASVSLLPFIVTSMAGEKANGYFSIAWTIAVSFQYLSNGMSASFTVEGSLDEKHLFSLARRSWVQLNKLMLPLIILTVVAAPIALRIFGDDYAREATTTLQLLSVGGLPFTVNNLFLNISRVKRRMGHVMLLQATLCLVTLGLSVVFIQSLGIMGVGLGYLVSQSSVAGFLLLTKLRPVLVAPLPESHEAVASH